ncbi:hypothetical protein QTP70_013564 [Hemibagrus guttatus]|uniref:Uncharacterized protein n=1 Tax=Hemibagrus guttatus TaxID=175788 RepID=A0AAE0PU95_9TELE|nr:hypothetical protein QTP70_013564 [Hemibagrus guttatus]
MTWLWCIKVGKEEEYWSVINSLMEWCQLYHLQQNARKTKDIVVDFCRMKSSPRLATIKGDGIEMLLTYKNLGVDQDDMLKITACQENKDRTGQNQL